MKFSLEGKVYSVKQAKSVAQQLQDNECDGWTYLVELSQNGDYARVNVYDETDTFVGRF